MPVDLRLPYRRAVSRLRAALAAVRARCSVVLAVAALGALILGVVGVALGQWIGWRAAPPPLPTDVEAATVARLALGEPEPLPSRRDELFGYDPAGHYGPGYVRFTVPADPRSTAFAAGVQDVRVRLATAGWRVDLGRPAGLLLVADKGDLRVRYTTGVDVAHIDILRRQPMWVLPAGALGGAAGAIAGWLLAGWGARRWRRLGSGAAGRRVAVLAVAGGLCMLPALGVAAVQHAAGLLAVSSPQIPLWGAAMTPVTAPFLLIGAFALAAALVLALVSRPAAAVADAG